MYYLYNFATAATVPIGMAEGVGFEPTSRRHETVFKTAAFSHSAIPPHSYLAYFIAC